MEFDFYRNFLVLAESNTMSAAARKLNIKGVFNMTNTQAITSAIFVILMAAAFLGK